MNLTARRRRPRSGFAPLSVVIHVMPLTGGRWTVGEDVQCAVEGVDGDCRSIVAEFAARGITDDLVYNRNFLLTGGPKWLRE
jgi:hypothetical protein